MHPWRGVLDGLHIDAGLRSALVKIAIGISINCISMYLHAPESLQNAEILGETDGKMAEQSARYGENGRLHIGHPIQTYSVTERLCSV